nr:hypothetical protein CFP56_52977 [Quercus suber]
MRGGRAIRAIWSSIGAIGARSMHGGRAIWSSMRGGRAIGASFSLRGSDWVLGLNRIGLGSWSGSDCVDRTGFCDWIGLRSCWVLAAF